MVFFISHFPFGVRREANHSKRGASAFFVTTSSLSTEIIERLLLPHRHTRALFKRCDLLFDSAQDSLFSLLKEDAVRLCPVRVACHRDLGYVSYYR